MPVQGDRAGGVNDHAPVFDGAGGGHGSRGGNQRYARGFGDLRRQPGQRVTGHDINLRAALPRRGLCDHRPDGPRLRDLIGGQVIQKRQPQPVAGLVEIAGAFILGAVQPCVELDRRRDRVQLVPGLGPQP